MTAPGSRARAVTGLGLGSLVVSLFFCAAIAIMGAILAGGGNPLGWVLLVFGVVLTAMMADAVRLWLRLTPAVTFTLGPGRAPGGGARPGAETAQGVANLGGPVMQLHGRRRAVELRGSFYRAGPTPADVDGW